MNAEERVHAVGQRLLSSDNGEIGLRGFSFVNRDH